VVVAKAGHQRAGEVLLRRNKQEEDPETPSSTSGTLDAGQNRHAAARRKTISPRREEQGTGSSGGRWSRDHRRWRAVRSAVGRFERGRSPEVDRMARRAGALRQGGDVVLSK